MIRFTEKPARKECKNENITEQNFAAREMSHT